MEDHADTRQMYVTHFRDASWQVEGVANGAEACAVAAAFMPSVIVTDLNMPELDGIATIRALKLDSRTRTIPVVVLTGHVARESEALSVGAVAVFAKPCDPSALAATLSKILDESPSTPRIGMR